MIDKIIPVNTDVTSGFGQHVPAVLGAVFFAVMAALIWKYLPKPLLLVLVVLLVVLFYAYHGKH